MASRSSKAPIGGLAHQSRLGREDRERGFVSSASTKSKKEQEKGGSLREGSASGSNNNSIVEEKTNRIYKKPKPRVFPNRDNTKWQTTLEGGFNFAMSASSYVCGGEYTHPAYLYPTRSEWGYLGCYSVQDCVFFCV